MVLITVEDFRFVDLVDQRTGSPLSTFITARFTQSFADCHGIVSRALTGKHQLSPLKRDFLEKQVAFHLGVLPKNSYETHFVVDVDNGRTLGFSGDQEVKYADAVSGGRE